MRHTLRNFWLLWLGLLLSVFVIKFVNAENEPLVIDLSGTVQHSSRLYNLNLWSETVGIGSLKVVKTPAKRVMFTNWLIIWSDHTVSVAANGHAVIGWWKSNTVSAEFAAVGWGNTNAASAEYAIVGGGQNNTASQENAVVVWGQRNVAGWANSVVVWWYNNTASQENAVVIGWKDNTANKNSLVLGNGSLWNEGGFAWNHSVTAQNWYINAENWVLVNTTTPIDWVNLVVNGAVKISEGDLSARLKWEIKYVGKCFYAYDGSKWYVLNRWGENGGNTECKDFTDIAKHCVFGNTVLQNGDSVLAWSQPYATDWTADSCPSSYSTTVTCNNGTLDPSGYTYPYCYPIHK